MHIHDVITTLRCRGITFLATADGKLRVEGVELLTETGSMRFPVEATRCCGVASGAELWKTEWVFLLLDC